VIGGHPFYRELSGQTLGLVGFGRIGRSVARLARAFGLRIVAVTRSPVTAADLREYGLAWTGSPAELPRLLSEADFVVLALPLTAESRNLIDRRELGLMKRTAFIVNIARAGLVDESALFEALRDKTIAGAALDPWWAYPTAAGETKSPSTLPFADLPNVIMTPHVAGGTLQTIEKRARFIATNIDRYLRGEAVLNVVQGPEIGTSVGDGA
jgi:phosphoglycerate dehydrogenase-like enzyme